VRDGPSDTIHLPGDLEGSPASAKLNLSFGRFRFVLGIP
jgi:hypothetical protein